MICTGSVGSGGETVASEVTIACQILEGFHAIWCVLGGEGFEALGHGGMEMLRQVSFRIDGFSDTKLSPWRHQPATHCRDPTHPRHRAGIYCANVIEHRNQRSATGSRSPLGMCGVGDKFDAG